MTREEYERRCAKFDAMVAPIRAEQARKEAERLNHLFTEATIEEINARLEEISRKLWGIEMADRLTENERKEKIELLDEEEKLNKRIAELKA